MISNPIRKSLTICCHVAATADFLTFLVGLNSNLRIEPLHGCLWVPPHSDREVLDLKLLEVRQKFLFMRVLERVFMKVRRVKSENWKWQISTSRTTPALMDKEE